MTRLALELRLRIKFCQLLTQILSQDLLAGGVHHICMESQDHKEQEVEGNNEREHLQIFQLIRDPSTIYIWPKLIFSIVMMILAERSKMPQLKIFRFSFSNRGQNLNPKEWSWRGL